MGPYAGESMMWCGVLVLMLTLTAGSATAQNAALQDAPFEAATVSDFLATCNWDTSQCDFKLRLTLLNKLNARDATSVCLKDAHTHAPVIAWLKAHPETHAMATEDGIYKAYTSLYPCP
jgi:hypothetical protein